MNWQNVKIGDLITQVRGVTYSSGDAIDVYKDGYVELLRANNIAEGHLTFDDVTYVPKSKVNEKQYLKQNDIVIAASSGSISVVGKAASFNANRLATFGAFCKVLRPNENVDARYIANYFQTSTYRRTVSALAEGANINNLRNEHIDNLDILLPPLAEQKRIAAILDKAADIKAKREQAIAKLDELAQSTFVEMFGEAKWRRVAIAEVTKQVQNCAPQSKFFGEFTYVDIGAVDNVSKKIINPQLLNKDDAPSRARQLIEKDDVLVSTVRPNLNAVAQVESEYLNAVASTGFCVLRCKQESVLPEYIFAIVKSRKFVKEMVRLATGASYPAVNDKIISQYLISLPPIELQRAFSEKIKTLRDYASKIVKHDDKLIRLTASLQNQAFTTGFDA